MKKKILKFILVGILLFITVIVIEFCCIYVAQGGNMDYLKDFWEWYKTFF